MPDSDLKMLKTNANWGIAMLGILAAYAVLYTAIMAGAALLSLAVIGPFLLLIAAFGVLFLLTDPPVFKPA